MIRTDPSKILKRLDLAWEYYDTSEKGWHVFEGVDHMSDTIGKRLLSAFKAEEWTCEASLLRPNQMRVCIR